MDLLNTFFCPEYKSKIYKSLFDDKEYSIINHIIKNISFPINIISDRNMKKCAMMIIAYSGYLIESSTLKYENYIKLILDLIFEQKNNFNKLFNKYNLKYKNKIFPEKTIIYLEFDYLGFNPIFSRFIKNIINFDKLVAQNNINVILNELNLVNDIDTNYLSYKKIYVKNLEKNDINGNKNMSLSEFFQYYFLKNKNKYITILSPYSNEKCKDILINIFDRLKFEINNNIIKRYDKYIPSKINFLSFEEPNILIIRKIEIENNNLMTLKFFFPNLNYESQNILDYIVYMINGKRIGSLYYWLFKNNFITDLKAKSIYTYNIPPQIIIKMKLVSSFSQFGLKIIISKLINFLRKLKADINNIRATYDNYQKMLLFNFNNNYDNNYSIKNNKEINYYSYLFEFTNNFILLTNKQDNENSSDKYLNLLVNKNLLPEYNQDLINNIIDDIISLKNLMIIMELDSKLYKNITNSIKRYSETILTKSIEINDFNTYTFAVINTIQIMNYAMTTQQWDNPSFKHKQDKKQYLSQGIDINTNNNLLLNNSKLQLGLNTIANKLWYYIPKYNNINSTNNMIMSKFHIIHPYIRNHSNNIYRINIKYFNYLDKKIEQEFEEIFDMGNDIKLTRDENGINLEIKAFKDIYIKILEKIFSFFFNFEKDFIEYNDVNYTTEYFKSDLDKAINCLHCTLKEDVKDNYFQEKNDMFDLFKLKLFGIYLEENIYIDSFIYGNIDKDLIKKLKKVFLAYNTREYDHFTIFENTTKFKKKILKTKIINEGHIYIYKLNQNFILYNINYFISFYQIIEFDGKKNIFLILIYLLMKKHLSTKHCEINKIFIDEIYYIVIIRKSLDYPEYMAKHVSNNIKKLIDIICNKPDKNLKNILLNLKNDFNEEILDNKKKYSLFWSQIYNGTYNFEFEIKEEKEFEDYISNKIDLNEFKNFFKNNFFYKQRKIEFLYYQESIKHFNNSNRKYNDSYPWNLEFINNNEFHIEERYYNISKITT